MKEYKTICFLIIVTLLFFGCAEDREYLSENSESCEVCNKDEDCEDDLICRLFEDGENRCAYPETKTCTVTRSDEKLVLVHIQNSDAEDREYLSENGASCKQCNKDEDCENDLICRVFEDGENRCAYPETKTCTLTKNGEELTLCAYADTGECAEPSM